MAQKAAAKTRENEAATVGGFFPYWVAAAGWAVPGLGHLLQKKWDRAAVFFISIATLAVVGLASSGHLYGFDLDSPFDFNTLGFLADICAGGFYVGAKLLGIGATDIGQSYGDYGTVLFLAAGLLNLLCLLDAYDIAAGKKD